MLKKVLKTYKCKYIIKESYFAHYNFLPKLFIDFIISDVLVETVKYKLEQFTGMQVDKINVYIEGVKVID